MFFSQEFDYVEEEEEGFPMDEKYFFNIFIF